MSDALVEADLGDGIDTGEPATKVLIDGPAEPDGASGRGQRPSAPS